MKIKKVRILKSAHEDIARSSLFYDTQQLGLGDRFIESIITEIMSLINTGGQHEKRYGLFRYVSKKFNSVIFYDIIEYIVVVTNVLDTRRDPKLIKTRVQE